MAAGSCKDADGGTASPTTPAATRPEEVIALAGRLDAKPRISGQAAFVRGDGWIRGVRASAPSLPEGSPGEERT